MTKATLLAWLLLGAASAALAPAALAQTVDPAAQRLFQQRCGACHQVETARNGVGPHLQGVIGRAAGSVSGYGYSPALRAAGLSWDATTLDTYLANPSAMLPGTRMTQRFANEGERRAIIGFLEAR